MMDDWNSDLLLQVIQFLKSQDAGNLAVQSRRFYYLVHQYRRLRGPELVSAASLIPGVRSRQLTVDQVCHNALSQLQAPPVLALAFSSMDSSNLLQTALPKRLPTETVVLGSMTRSIQTAGKGECEYRSNNALMLLSGLSANTAVRPFCVHSRLVEEDDQHLDSFRDSFEQSLDWKMIIVYVCGDGVQIAESVIQLLQQKFPEVTIVGGVCDSAYVSVRMDHRVITMEKLNQCPALVLRQMNQAMGGPNPPHALTKAQLVEHVHAVAQTKLYSLETIHGAMGRGGICGVALAGDVPVRSVVSRGVKSLTSIHGGGDGTPQPETSFFVHEAAVLRQGDEGYMFMGFDPPPYHLIRSIRDDESGRIYTVNEMIRKFGQPDFLGLRHPHHDGFPLESPHPISSNLNAFLLIPESGIEEDETFVGCNVDLFDLSGQECMKDMDYCMAKLREQTSGENVLGGIMFSCSGRGPAAGEWITEEMADAKRFAKVFPNVPCLGFYAGGEIGPLALAGRQCAFQHGNARMQGFTAVLALFIVPRFDLDNARGLDDCKESVDSFIQSRLLRSDGD